MKSWKTTTSALIAILYVLLPDLRLWINTGVMPDFMPLLPLLLPSIGLLFAKDSDVTHAINSGDAKTVEGGGIQIGIQLVALLMIPTLFFSSCSTLTTWQANPKVQLAEQVAGSIIMTGLAQYGNNGGHLDNSFAIGVGMNAISQVVRATVSNQQAANLIDATAKSFAADPKLSTVANQLAQAYVDANPQTAGDREATVLALSSGITNAATAMLKK